MILCVNCVVQLSSFEEALKEKEEFVDPEEYDRMKKSKLNRHIQSQ